MQLSSEPALKLPAAALTGQGAMAPEQLIAPFSSVQVPPSTVETARMVSPAGGSQLNTSMNL